MIIEILNRNSFIDQWDSLRPYVRVACDKVNQDIKEVLFNCVYNPNFLITKLMDEKLIGVAIFQRIENRLHAVIVSGDLPEGYEIQITEYMEELALKLNLTSLSLEGRKGWEKKLKHLGWNKNGSILERKI